MNKIHYVKENEYINGKTDSIFTNLNSKHSVLMEKLKYFYNNKDNLNTFLSTVNNETKLSLRIIDFFITNYARENEIIYNVDKVRFMVYYSYKSQLKAYSKKQFDPFCRRERILFFIDKYDGTQCDPIRTTVGQLNFFRWAITNNVLDYIAENYSDIESKMNKIYKKDKKKYTKPAEDNMTLSASKKISKHNITITVKFNK